MGELTKQYFDEQFEFLARTVKSGFDHVDEEIADLKTDVADLKTRMCALEDEVRTLSRNMVTKQYLDAKLDIFIQNQQRDSTFKRMLLLALEQSKALDSTTRAKLEQLIPS